jgi:NAD+ synthase
LWAHNHAVPVADLATGLGIEVVRAEHVYADIENKRRMSRILLRPGILVQDVPEV